MELLPRIKKELKSFILEEKGGAQKQVLISLGAMFAGIEALALFSKIVAGQTISVKHDHCDPGHGSGITGHGSGGWGHTSATRHSSADGVPASHCSVNSHVSGVNIGGSQHISGNAAHKNYVYLSYG